MALSTPPPPSPNPPSTTGTTTTTATNSTATTRPLFPNPRPPPLSHTLPHPHLYHPHPIPSTSSRLLSSPTLNFPLQLAPKPPHPHPLPQPHPPANILYPLASSGRNFLAQQPPVTLSTPNANPNLNTSMYPARPGVLHHHQPGPPIGYTNRAHLDPGLGQLGQGLGFIRPPANLHHTLVGPTSAPGGVMPGVVKGVPVSKICSNQTSNMDSNGYKDIRDRSRDDNYAIIRDRKVRTSENASVYALCRSWLRNGFPEETQPHYIDVVKSLPRPLPLAPQDSHSPGKREDDKEEEDGGFVEHLSPQDLLQRHIKRAKRVRSRLREERHRRIDRYKTRLALLLPPMVDQQFQK